MELLISILMWLGLISNGTTYTVTQIREIEAHNQAAVSAKMVELQASNTSVERNSQADITIIGL
ncbi:MAG: hypothetical protein FGM24_05315 [Candidatus Kapabacteria bacterium]|nr:hypothetical protein [Candidatus Kapabacteria bacterium]